MSGSHDSAPGACVADSAVGDPCRELRHGPGRPIVAFASALALAPYRGMTRVWAGRSDCRRTTSSARVHGPKKNRPDQLFVLVEARERLNRLPLEDLMKY